MLTRALVLACLACGCHNDDPGFDIVKVPLSAYAARDASTDAHGDAHADAGRDLIVICIEKPEEKKEDDEKKDDDEEKAEDDCPTTYQDRSYDEKATARHHKNDGEGNVCCYRRGHLAPRVNEPEGE